MTLQEMVENHGLDLDLYDLTQQLVAETEVNKMDNTGKAVPLGINEDRKMSEQQYEDWMAGELTHKEGTTLMNEHMATNQLMDSKKYRAWLDARESSKSDENMKTDTVRLEPATAGELANREGIALIEEQMADLGPIVDTLVKLEPATAAVLNACDFETHALLNSVSEMPKKVVKQVHFETCGAFFGTADIKKVRKTVDSVRENRIEIRNMLRSVLLIVQQDSYYNEEYNIALNSLIKNSDFAIDDRGVEADVLAAFAVGFNAEDPGATHYELYPEDTEHAERCRLQLNAEFPEAPQLEPCNTEYKMPAKEKCSQELFGVSQLDLYACAAQKMKDKMARQLLDNVMTAANPAGVVDLLVTQQVELAKLNDDKTLPTNANLFNALNK